MSSRKRNQIDSPDLCKKKNSGSGDAELDVVDMVVEGQIDYAADDHRPSTSTAASGYEYLDHSADVQLHAWAPTMEGAVEQLVVSMFGYATDLEFVEEAYDFHWECQGRDLHTLIFSILDEPLVSFTSEPFFVAKRVRVTRLDLKEWSCHIQGWGESFELPKHSQKADVKAITYSNMQVHHTGDRHDIYVIVDI